MKPDDMAALDVDGQSGFLQQEDTGNRVCFTSPYYRMLMLTEVHIIQDWREHLHPD